MLQMPHDRESADRCIDKLLLQQPGGRFLKFILGKKSQQELVRKFQERAKLRNKSCQTETKFEEKSVDATAKTTATGTQMDRRTKDKAVQAGTVSRRIVIWPPVEHSFQGVPNVPAM